MGGANPLDLIRTFHYTRSVPSGKTHIFTFESAIVLFSIPANHNISRWLVNEPNKVWELSRLWAPDGHRRNLLTEAISFAVRSFRQLEPAALAVVSYADPNAGHLGGVYRAASWVYLGQSEEGRSYRDKDGHLHPRRAFHQGSNSMTKREIEALGYEEVRLPGKHRFAKGLSKQGRRLVENKRLEVTE